MDVHRTRRNILFLCIIVFLAGVLRFYQLDQIPHSLYWDETAIAYNAYSISQTAKDEYGQRLPILFRSFDDYKLPGIIYLTAIPVKLFGLNEFSARFTSALFGTLTILATYLLAQELLKQGKLGSKKPNKEIIKLAVAKSTHQRISPQYYTSDFSLLTALLLSISPWHIFMSRANFEANVGLFFVVLGMWLFLKGLSRQLFLPLSAVIFALSLYFYRSIQLFVPLLMASSIIIFWSTIKRVRPVYFVSSFLLGVFILAPLVPQMISPGGLTRFQQTNIFDNSQELLLPEIEKIENAGGGMLAKIVYNRRWLYGKIILTNYLKHFSPIFLFWDSGVNDRGNMKNHGMFYFWELPFIIIGIITIGKYFPKKITLFTLSWILLAPLPAALTLPSPHTLRALNLLPIPQLLIALGLGSFLTWVSHKRKITAVFIIGLILTISLINFLLMYVNDWSQKTASAWADGYQQLVAYVSQYEKQYDAIVVSGHYWKPYIYFLFYKKYDPVLYQETGHQTGFGKYTFGGTGWGKNEKELDHIDLANLIGTKKTLLALSPSEYNNIKENVCLQSEIKNSVYETVFIVGTYKPKQVGCAALLIKPAPGNARDAEL